MTVFKEAPLVSLLPNRKSRTGSPPGLDYFGVRSRLGTNPLKQVENQRLYCVCHNLNLMHLTRARSLCNSHECRLAVRVAQNEIEFGLDVAGPAGKLLKVEEIWIEQVSRHCIAKRG